MNSISRLEQSTVEGLQMGQMDVAVAPQPTETNHEATHQGLTAIPFEFTGKASEFFKIWIVNICLSILTLGIYSAWAKVRTTRYFYANTRLKGSAFEYLANPITILKGRAIAFTVLAAYGAVQSFYPAYEWVFIPAFLCVLPWLVVKAMTFRLRNTAYRNVRFDFRGSYGEAAWVYVGLFLLNIVTFGLAFPYVVYRMNRFLVTKSSYGTRLFDSETLAKDFYVIYLKALGQILLAVVGMIALLSIVDGNLQNLDGSSNLFNAIMGGVFLLVLPFYLWLAAYVQTAVTNLVWNHAILDGHKLKSTLKARTIFWIYLSNAVAIILSLGLLIPWAMVRMAKYRLDNITFLAVSDIDGFVAAEHQRVGATGEGISDMFDVDIGL